MNDETVAWIALVITSIIIGWILGRWGTVTIFNDIVDYVTNILKEWR